MLILYRDLYSRDMLDDYLSRALSIELEDKRLALVDKSDYVLTLDYTIKMLNIHERFSLSLSHSHSLSLSLLSFLRTLSHTCALSCACSLMREHPWLSLSLSPHDSLSLSISTWLSPHDSLSLHDSHALDLAHSLSRECIPRMRLLLLLLTLSLESMHSLSCVNIHDSLSLLVRACTQTTNITTQPLRLASLSCSHINVVIIEQSEVTCSSA